ncbi:MAG TPA: peptidoglycan-binding protein [Jatrophihabitans sp.]|uniref:peptidoglycan-binding domain-containing protein n=1 Tax=Jatrophihabitans sp. TaxID=1932789 RepID=UPI002F12100F
MSSLIGGSDRLVQAGEGGVRIMAPEQSDAVLRIQQALLVLGYSLPDSGPDGSFGTETGDAVVAFKTDRGLVPNDPVVGPGTTTRLDREVAFMEGVALDQAAVELASVDPAFTDPPVLARDPLIAGRLDQLRPDLGIPDKILQFFELSDEFCLPLSPLVGPQVASVLGKLVDPKIMDDYCQLVGPCTGFDFFDLANDSSLYEQFLTQHNPGVPGPAIDAVAASVRPDIIRHRGDEKAWYETKPLTPSGLVDWMQKAARLKVNYALTLPYGLGKVYRPSKEILLGRFTFTEGGGGQLEVFIEPRRPAPGMILYRICLRGDYVRYFNQFRLVAGILTILVALAPEVLAAGTVAAEVAAVIAAIHELAASFGVALVELTPAL